jgi:catechol 2,3-dioxygenase
MSASPKLAESLDLGPVHITVTDLDRSVGFYQDAIGLQIRERGDTEASLSAGGGELLHLVEDRDARPAGRHAGLYHFALLHPSRDELARTVNRLATTRTPISGASDHGISEAIYLPDPDGNGIELAADRSRDRWGDLSDPATIGPQPLDLEALLSTVAGDERRPHADPAVAVGHLHLHVGNVDQGLSFYRDLIGFEVQTLFPSAAFVSVGGYHHHLAFNTWRGEGVPPAPEDSVGLRHWTMLLDGADLEAVKQRLADAGIGVEDRRDGGLVRDPWDNALLLAERGA